MDVALRVVSTVSKPGLCSISHWGVLEADDLA
jgi:hypothetical protein